MVLKILRISFICCVFVLTNMPGSVLVSSVFAEELLIYQDDECYKNNCVNADEMGHDCDEILMDSELSYIEELERIIIDRAEAEENAASRSKTTH